MVPTFVTHSFYNPKLIIKYVSIFIVYNIIELFYRGTNREGTQKIKLY